MLWILVTGGCWQRRVQPTPCWNVPAALLAAPKGFSPWEWPAWIAEGVQGKHRKVADILWTFLEGINPDHLFCCWVKYCICLFFLSPPEQKTLTTIASLDSKNIFTRFARHLIYLPFCRAPLNLISWIFFGGFHEMWAPCSVNRL